jgi:hypothetical protein
MGFPFAPFVVERLLFRVLRVFRSGLFGSAFAFLSRPLRLLR